MTRREAQVGDVISAEGLCMRYRTKDVLRDVSFKVCRGEVVALLGPNGAGKTTTVELAGKLLTSSPSVLIYLLMIGVPGAFITGGLHLADIFWARLAWVLLLGMAGTQLFGAWVLAGLIIAPLVLRRMARRESGSRVTQRRNRALQRTS